jgi:hypothetical protein
MVVYKKYAFVLISSLGHGFLIQKILGDLHRFKELSYAVLVNRLIDEIRGFY